MNIAPITSAIRKFPKNTNNVNNQINKKNTSFKGIFIDALANPGHVKAGMFPAKFQKKDALLLQEIAAQYPNQDCFIRRGVASLPRLEYREKPVDIEVFDTPLTGRYVTHIDPDDPNYPTVQLILYDESKANELKRPSMTFLIGVPSYISTNPSLPFTIKAGYELHKKILEKKYQIMDVVGQNDEVSLGEDSIIEKCHEAIEDEEIAVTRYLIESAYSALTDRAEAKQIYSSKYPKVQTRFDAKRRLDLTTPLAKQPDPPSNANKDDLCEYAMQTYPNTQENKERINELVDYMEANGITLFNSEHF